jgi:hypothetical protein
MGCLPQETYQSFVSQQSAPELTAPAFESRDVRARLRKASLGRMQ